jgi:uncharacterized alpha-E superfamily protein
MLSRIANSLFWMGRYLERADQSARYIKVHYYSALDAPLASKHEFIFESILTMLGLDEEYKKTSKNYQEDKINNLITLDETNHVSIRSSIIYARENARGARDSISAELWGAINKFYHFVNGFSESDLKKEGIYFFTDKIMENCSIVSGYIDNSLLHDKTWSLIRMGMHLERASQTTRVMYSKVKDIEKIEKQKLGKPIESYHCVTMLKSLEAFDMSRIYYRALPNMHDALEFLILNKEFPRSISFNFQHINSNLNKISTLKYAEQNSVEFEVGKLNATYRYMTMEEIEEDTLGFLENALNEIYEVGKEIEKKYLSY